ncbi:RluA family pseudouridine synthase [Treponema sp. OMZ 840]|uniref:RluA family pseudouridine synthase n=1 Tax=Treponema sp. OMZ 840 TaxID=244313 RepID=UPI003D8A343E
MVFEYFFITDDDENRRLERIARKFLKHLPLSLIHKSIRNGCIKINGEKKDASYRVQKGDRLDIDKTLVPLLQHGSVSDSACFSADAPHTLFTDIFINEHIRIVNKAYGVPVQGGNPRIPCADERIKKEYAENSVQNSQHSLSFVPGPLHRLDRRTTGLLVFSQSLSGARWFSKALAEHRIQKKYITVLEGRLTQNSIWEHYIEKHTAKNSRAGFNTVTVHGTKGTNGDCSTDMRGSMSKNRAQTEVHPLAYGMFGKKELTLVSVGIQTGKMHQIRSQAAFCGYPLLGDTAYGASFFSFPDSAGQRLFLHAYTLGFEKDNPLGLPPKISAPLPPFFRQFIEKYLPAFKLSTYTDTDEIY